MVKTIGDGAVIDVGDIGGDVRDQQIESLKTEIRRLQRAVADAEVEAKRAREDADRALSMLRRQLSPLYRALQAVFGELDAAGVTDGPTTQASTPTPNAGPDGRVKAVWEAWKQKLNAPCGRIIDALLIHSDMNTTQISVAAQMHKSNVSKAIQKLHEVGLINKSGGRFSLKQL